MVAEAFEAYGVKHVVTSPGSRNAPLIMAVARRDMCVHSVIDERSAAFIALGMAAAVGEPVALICTSGTALLNYAPAVAEAYYRQLPLIVVSADRPEAWIDQNDSQTIRQPGALASIVRCSVVVPGEISSDDEVWLACRRLNDAFTEALSGPRGPVHINVPLAMPLTTEAEGIVTPLFHKIEILSPDCRIATDMARRLAARCEGRKVLVVATQCAPDSKVNSALAALSELPGVAVIAEDLANIHARRVMGACDRMFSAEISDDMAEALNPDILISFGGAAVSDRLKRFLRRLSPREGWYVGHTDGAVDCYRSLTMRIDIEPRHFFPRFSAAMGYLARRGQCAGEYARIWSDFALGRICPLDTEVTALRSSGHWCAPLAVETIIREMKPDASRWNLQLGNGMSVRYAQAFGAGAFHRVDSNRGVSGIDGSVSTAVGASCVSHLPTLLLVGDMSMQYDLGALASTLVTPRLAIVVFSNGGGGIFDYVRTTRSLPELGDYFRGHVCLPLRDIARAYGFRYLRAGCFDSLVDGVSAIRCSARGEAPLVLEVVTDSADDARMFARLTGEI